MSLSGFQNLTVDLNSEQKRLYESLRRLQRTILFISQNPSEASTDVTRTMQLHQEINSLNQGLFRIGRIAETLSEEFEVDPQLSLQTIFLELKEKWGARFPHLICHFSDLEEWSSFCLIRNDKSEILQNIDSLVTEFMDFSVESNRERELRGKPKQVHLKLLVKKSDLGIKVSIILDVNGLVPPRYAELSVNLSSNQMRAQFEGRATKWSCWHLFIPHQSTKVSLRKILIDGVTYFIPAWCLSEVKEGMSQGRCQIVVHSGCHQRKIGQVIMKEESSAMIRPIPKKILRSPFYVGLAIDESSPDRSLLPVLSPHDIVFGKMADQWLKSSSEMGVVQL